MIREKIMPKLKMAFCDYINENFEYEEGNYMGIPACLSDHEVFKLDGKLPFDTFGFYEAPEYVMFLEKARKGPFGDYQMWDFFAFSEDELEEVAKANGIFSLDELRYMEAFEHYDDEEE